MLLKNLYNLCILLSTSYESLNSINNTIDILPPFIRENLFHKKLFYFKWSEKFHSSFNNLRFTYSYDILDQNSKFIKIKLTLNYFFTIENNLKSIPSGCIYEYILILEHFHDKYKLQFLLEHEENPCLYNSLLNTDLEEIPNLSFYPTQSLWINKLSSLESLYTTYMDSIGENQNSIKRNDSNFNITDACTYAEKFALTPNPNYKSFENIGGDCTNFISQILFAGGLKQNNSWKPYSMPWIRVEDLYQYLTTNKLAIKLPSQTILSKGCVIQFYTPEIGRYFHNGFITYELPNHDYLYCCHSYNKLNYPLSQIYPHRYPVLRALKII
ncbi:amidase domain-containing protein [Clostridium sp. C2-6-12]|uniref:amidase domain-containing protein n=1 Tax=Clostridium sp. C2-6-12 TaxID=2698832 RepID=UPI00136AA2D2|nr:amidase domain-containing protein [Clostridium sp. C2-6-12]